MKKRLQRGVSCFLCCLFLAAAALPAGRAADAAASELDAEQRPLLIVLLDVSGSMKANDSDGGAVAWAVALSADLQELGVDVEAITFGEQVGSLDLKEVSNGVKLYGETRTDQSKAIERAKTIVDEDPARRTCIVMLTDGALDLCGRGIDDVDEYADRTEDEKGAIEAFQETCEELGAGGCQLFLVGYGASDGELEDPCAIRGFGMLKSVDGKPNCRFLRARELDLSELTEYVFHSLGYQHSMNDDIQMTGRTITFSLDRSYYKTHICISRTSADPVEKEQTVVERDGEAYPPSSFHINDEYKSMIVLCLDGPSAGDYEIVLPDVAGNRYTLLHQTSFDIRSLDIRLIGDQAVYVSSSPPTYAIPDGGAGCQLEISLGHSGVTGSDIGDSWYTVQLERTDGMEGGDADPLKVPFDWGGDPSAAVVPLELPEPSPKPSDIADVTYTVQAHSIGEDGEQIDSDPIRIQLREMDADQPVCTEFSGCAGEAIDISPRNWSKVDANDDLDYWQYYMLEQALAPGETLTGKMSLTLPCETETYELVRDEEGAVKVVFKQPGEYYMAIDLYGQAKAKGVGHFTITDPWERWKDAAPAAAGIAAVVVIAAAISLAKRHGKRERG